MKKQNKSSKNSFKIIYRNQQKFWKNILAITQVYKVFNQIFNILLKKVLKNNKINDHKINE